MQKFFKWTLESIREDGAQLSWLEELRFEFSTTISLAIRQIIEGKTVVIITDRDRKWFETYIKDSINRGLNERPMIPVVPIDALYSSYDSIVGGELIDMLEDMLKLSFGDEFFFFYIGKGNDVRSDIAKRSSTSLLWLMDEEFSNSMPLRSHDPHLDIKLLQLFKLFDKTLSAALFGEVDVEE